MNDVEGNHDQQNQSYDFPRPLVRRRSRFVPSLIWIVPIVAIIAAISLTLRTYFTTGPRITVSFQTAEGLETDKTEVRYKEVVIGHVSGMLLSEDHTRVLVHIHLNSGTDDFTFADTRFWVVRPRVGMAGISGLGTLISGAYIAADIGTSHEQKKDFIGLETPPAVLRGKQGRTFTLRSDDLGSLDIGSPVYYRRIQVGRISGYQLDNDGKAVTMQLFVNAPYDHFVTTSSHFWNASGIDLALSANGFKLNTESLATVLVGGVAFQSIDDTTSLPAAEGANFDLYHNIGDAMSSPDGPSLEVRMRFNETLRGLAVGSTVDFRGVVIGVVKSINLDFVPESQTFPADVVATIYPQRMGRITERFLETGEGKINFAGVLQSLVEHGFRAQVRTGNLLTQQLYIAIDTVPNAKPIPFDMTMRPIEIPTAPGTFDELQKQLTDLVHKLDQVPFVQIGTELRDVLRSARILLGKIDTEITPEAKALLTQAQLALKSLDHDLAEDSPLQHSVGQTLDEIGRAAQSLRVLGDFLSRHPEALIRGKRTEMIPPTLPPVE